MTRGAALTLSLISHTNVGKTTLARTLLRRDVGEVRDQPHVTDQSEVYPLVETPEGGRVVLWDTPGFGDSPRLLKRLEGQGNPLGWLLAQVWDRFADRPLWCSQQAVKNVREEADVVLYLVNAAEDPELSNYVDAEMAILAWVGRPVIVLLNQTGLPRPVAQRREDEARWRVHLRRFPVVREVLSLDAFTRCWVQEGVLLERIAAVLPSEARDAMAPLVARWREDSVGVFGDAMARLAGLLAAAAADREAVSAGPWVRLPRRRATTALARRLEARTREVTAALIALHGLEGQAAAEVQARLEDVAAPGERPDPWKAGLLGGVAGGALGGLAADLASGGLTFGGGAVAGALLGAMGLGGLAWGYQLLGEEEPRVTWAREFLDRQARDALLRYLAVAHFGRGGGQYAEREEPGFWRAAVERALSRRVTDLGEAWRQAQTADRDAGERRARALLVPLLEDAAREVLVEFYPEAAGLLSG